MRKQTGWLLLLVLALACGDKKTTKSGTPAGGGGRQQGGPLAVVGHVVKTGPVSEPIQLPGNLLAMEETNIQPEVSGRVVALNLREGSVVTAGTLLVKLFDGDLQAQLKKLEVQLQIAEKTEERNRELLRISGISQQDYDLSFLQVSNIKADIELIRTSIAKTEIRAPFTGTIGFKNISPGAYITPTTIVTSIRQINQLKLQFSVPEKYTSRIRTGDRIRFSVEGSPRKYTARVYATESIVNELNRGMNLRCLVEEKDASLVAGAFAKVDVDFARNDQAILVPSQAILPQARGKKVVVFRDGIASFTDVKTGIRDSANVEIISGIRPGDTIVITGLLGIKPDAPLKLSKVQ
ncbi:MAG TPA: efflux RND transporter periplasmic adaptor subunit [Lacibacter sp.]|nr:efflux RND transporter periplasmic adaptor subunit [Lacibacter sp.]HMO89081.1 efflux RND transporter periplasmic adaptor subunit [Lacibacter sp.]HMP86368.1 efflux RND transporter periplasmic adaptor subunit [Lacibacter sp.]